MSRGADVRGLLAAVSVAALVVAVGLAGWFLITLGLREPTPARTVAPADPVSLRVPGLDIRAAVVPIELSADAVLEPPADPDVVGWWDGSAQPGAESGTVVVTGHTLYDGGGAMAPLVDLDSGVVTLRTRNGPQRYEVVSREVVRYEDLPARAEEIFGQDEPHPDGAPLVLVTCTEFDGSVHRSNVVVTAVPVRDSVL